VPSAVAVIGAGVVGLATSAALLEAGAEATCFEAVGPMTQRSAGGTRIFRLAHGRPELVELAQRARQAYQRWDPGLVGTEGTLVSRPDAQSWAEAMRTAGAAVEIRDGSPGLPDGRSGELVVPGLDLGPVLMDPAGGVIRAAGVGRFLLERVSPHLVNLAVTRLEPTTDSVWVHTPEASTRFDACVIVAGAGTAALAEQVGLSVGTPLEHHARFTFSLRDPLARPPCLLDKSQAWQPGFTSYQHLAAPGRWAIGAHLASLAVDVATVGKQTAIDEARELTVRYARENLPWLEPEPVDQVYCDPPRAGGDGFLVRRSDRVLCLYGDNLFKFAPVLGSLLANAAVDGSVFDSIPPESPPAG
jgi:sarcosine oxidase